MEEYLRRNLVREESFPPVKPTFGFTKRPQLPVYDSTRDLLSGQNLLELADSVNSLDGRPQVRQHLIREFGEQKEFTCYLACLF